MALTIFTLDPKTAGELNTAIRLYRQLLHRRGKGETCTERLVDLEALALEIGEGREGTSADIPAPVVEDGAYNRGDDLQQILTQTAAAEILGVTPKTVGRMLDRGELRGVGPRGKRRVPRSEIERLIRGERS